MILEALLGHSSLLTDLRVFYSFSTLKTRSHSSRLDCNDPIISTLSRFSYCNWVMTYLVFLNLVGLRILLLSFATVNVLNGYKGLCSAFQNLFCIPKIIKKASNWRFRSHGDSKKVSGSLEWLELISLLVPFIFAIALLRCHACN